MPRIRPESLLGEFSRTRNAKQILELPLSHGFSVVPTSEGGLFVDRSHPAAIGNSAYASFSSGDVKDCEELVLSRTSTNAVDRSFLILEDFAFKKSVGTVRRESDLFDAVASNKQPIKILQGRKMKPGAFWKTAAKLIQHDAIREVGESSAAETVVISIELTRDHEGIMVFDVSGDTVKEVYKKVYYVSEPAIVSVTSPALS